MGLPYRDPLLSIDGEGQGPEVCLVEAHLVSVGRLFELRLRLGHREMSCGRARGDIA